MKLKLDENLSHAAADLFRREGHDVHSVHDEGLSGAADEEVLTACRHEERGLVTLDLDFSNPLVFNPANSPGVMVLRLPAKPSHQDLLAACETLIQALKLSSVAGRLWSDERGRIREYRPDPSA